MAAYAIALNFCVGTSPISRNCLPTFSIILNPFFEIFHAEFMIGREFPHFS